MPDRGNQRIAQLYCKLSDSVLIKVFRTLQSSNIAQNITCDILKRTLTHIHTQRRHTSTQKGIPNNSPRMQIDTHRHKLALSLQTSTNVHMHSTQAHALIHGDGDRDSFKQIVLNHFIIRILC